MSTQNPQDTAQWREHTARLEALRRKIDTAEAEVARLRTERAETINRALESGMQVTALSRASGVSREWIYKTRSA